MDRLGEGSILGACQSFSYWILQVGEAFLQEGSSVLSISDFVWNFLGLSKIF
jgi:hypothetical protein